MKKVSLLVVFLGIMLGVGIWYLYHFRPQPLLSEEGQSLCGLCQSLNQTKVNLAESKGLIEAKEKVIAEQEQILQAGKVLVKAGQPITIDSVSYSQEQVSADLARRESQYQSWRQAIAGNKTYRGKLEDMIANFSETIAKTKIKLSGAEATKAELMALADYQLADVSEIKAAGGGRLQALLIRVNPLKSKKSAAGEGLPALLARANSGFEAKLEQIQKSQQADLFPDVLAENFIPTTSWLRQAAVYQAEQIEEQKRKAAEEEQQRRQAEAEKQRKAAEEQQRRQAEVERQKKAAEEQQHQQAEAERQKQEQLEQAEVERQKKAAEEDQRQRAEAERQKKAAEEQQRQQAEVERKQKEAEEQQRQQAETEKKQKEAEKEQRRQAEAEIDKKLMEIEKEERRQAEIERQKKAAEEDQSQQAEAEKKKKEAAEQQRRQAEAEIIDYGDGYKDGLPTIFINELSYNLRVIVEDLEDSRRPQQFLFSLPKGKSYVLRLKQGDYRVISYYLRQGEERWTYWKVIEVSSVPIFYYCGQNYFASYRF